MISGQMLDRDIVNLFVTALNNSTVRAEISKQIRIEMDNDRNKYNGSRLSYESLTSGNVNMQAKMAASGYNIYGSTIIKGNYNASNNNTYRKMKNRIRYGKPPQDGYINHGDFNMI